MNNGATYTPDRFEIIFDMLDEAIKEHKDLISQIEEASDVNETILLFNCYQEGIEATSFFTTS